jgi:hypothetical protein
MSRGSCSGGLEGGGGILAAAQNDRSAINTTIARSSDQEKRRKNNSTESTFLQQKTLLNAFIHSGALNCFVRRQKSAAKDGAKILVIAPINVCGHHPRFFKCVHAKRIVCAKLKSEFPFRYLLDARWLSLLFMVE